MFEKKNEKIFIMQRFMLIIMDYYHMCVPFPEDKKLEFFYKLVNNIFCRSKYCPKI